MPLSLNKLTKFLSSKGFYIKKIYVYQITCVYIEIVSQKDLENLLLYIPSKYEIKFEGGYDFNKVNYIEINEDGYIPNDYAGEPDNFDIEKDYDNLDFFSIARTNNTIKNLEENYNHQVHLKDIDKNDTTELRDILRQLRRFKFCVNGHKYKLAILYKNYLCCIRRDENYEAFAIFNFPGKNERKLFVTIDLESFYEKVNSVAVDTKTIKNGIYKILDRNQIKNTTNLKNMLETQKDISKFSEQIYAKKIKYSSYIENLEKLLEDVTKSETKLMEKLQETQKKYNDVSIKGLHIDIEKSHVVSKIDDELNKILKTKKDIIANIQDIQNKREDLSLKVDKIFFDSSIMLDAIIKNFLFLENL